MNYFKKAGLLFYASHLSDDLEVLLLNLTKQLGSLSSFLDMDEHAFKEIFKI